MTYNLPPLGSPNSKSPLPSGSEFSVDSKPEKVVKNTQQVDRMTEQLALEKLALQPQASEASESNSVWGGGIWSWFGLGRSIDLHSKKEEETQSEEEGEMGWGWGDLDDDFNQEREDLGHQAEEAVGQLGTNIKSSDLLGVLELKESAPMAMEDKPLNRTIVKTYQVAQQTSWQKFQGGLMGAVDWAGSTWVGSAIINRIASSYDKFDKETVVAAQKEEMLAQLGDPQYVEFYEVVNSVLLPMVKEQVSGALAKKTDTLSKTVVSQEGLILKLVDVILARGFANLARQVKENEEEIPNFAHQPSLVSVISLLCQKTSQHIDQKRLDGISLKYQKDQVDLLHHIQILFPDIASRVNEKVSLELYIQEYIISSDHQRKEKIKNDLFPNFEDLTTSKKKKIRDFFLTLDNLHLKQVELKQLFTQLSDDILLYLFPNKLKDIKELDGIGSYWFGDMAFNMIRDVIARNLQEIYEPLENNASRNEIWEGELKIRLGAPNLQPVVEAPSAFLMAFTKQYIQSDPNLMANAATMIDEVFHPSITIPIKTQLKELKDQLTRVDQQQDKALIEALEIEINKIGQKNQDLNELRAKRESLQEFQTAEARNQIEVLNQKMDALMVNLKNLAEKRKNVLNQLSQQQLANWIVESAQTLLSEKDPHIAGLIDFFKQSLNNLTLALITKGSELIIIEGENIEPNAFIKEFSKRLIEKAADLHSDEAVSEKFWENFVGDLPLPSFVKKLLVPTIIEKAKSLQNELKERKNDFEEVKRIHEEAYQKMGGYEEGEQLISISEKITDQLIERVLKQNIELVSASGLGDTIDELFIHYLPGITIDQELKNWFRENMSSLGESQEGGSPQTIAWLKDGFQAVLLKAMVNTIEKNFQNNSKDYAAQLLTNFQSVFSDAFRGFSDIQREQLSEALIVYSELDNKNKLIAKVRKEMSERPIGATVVQALLLDDVIAGTIRHNRASHYLTSLEAQRENALQLLNERQNQRKWSVADLSLVNEALVLRKIEEPIYSSTVDFVKSLKERIIALNLSEERGELSVTEKKELKNRRLLLSLTQMTPPSLKNLSEVVTIHATLKHAENEFNLLTDELNAKEKAITDYEKKDIKNLEEWNAAKKWKDLFLTGKHESVQLLQEIEELERKLDAQLGVFQSLSKGLTGLLGWDQKESLDLPPFLQDEVWPLIESVQKKQFARLLFTEITPLLGPIVDMKKNKERLEELSHGNPFFGQLIHVTSKEVISRIPDYLNPEEIAIAINDVIPGATDLHSLIASQIQSVILGEDKPFIINRDLLQQFLEGTILKLFVKMAEVNQSKDPTKDPLSVITGKLKNLAMHAVPEEGQTPEEVARKMIDQVLIDILDIQSKDDLDMIPPSFKELVHKILKEQAYLQLTPFLLPMIERNQNRILLEKLSGSNFMGSLCEALSKDVFTLVPITVKSYHAISEELLILLSNNVKPTPEQIVQFAEKMKTLVEQKNVKDHLLVEAFAQVTKTELNQDERDDLRSRLKIRGAKNEINNILISPEDITDLIGTLVPHLDENIQVSLANEMQKFIQGGSESYLNGSSFIGSYIEGVLLKVFIGVAQKNPKELSLDSAVPSKESMIVLTEKLLHIATERYQEARKSHDFQQIGQELNDAIMQDVLGIDSPDAFKGLPSNLQLQAYEAIKNQIAGMVLRIQEGLATIESSDKQVVQAKEEVKKFGIAAEASKGYVQILAEDIANMVAASVPHTLAEISGVNLKGVFTVSKGIETYLEDLSRGNIQMAKVMLDYAQGDRFKEILEESLQAVADPELYIDDKQKAADLIGNLLLKPLGETIEKTIAFEEMHKKQFNQKLMGKILHLGAEHLKHLNDAKDLAAQEGRKTIQHKDFLAAVGPELHPAIPVSPVNYQQTVSLIKERLYAALTPEQEIEWLKEQQNLLELIADLVKQEQIGSQMIQLDEFVKKFEAIHLKIVGSPLTADEQRVLKNANQDGLTLRDIIRQEADAPTQQRRNAAYDPATKALLKMLFPNGKKDLTFLPPELRGTVWKQFKNNLFPIVLPMLTELILDPVMINTIVLSSLENVNETLKEKIVLGESEPADLELDELDQVAGELVAQALRATTLPGWAKKLLIDPKTGEITDSMKKTVGATLRSQFNDTFIKDKLGIALKNAVKRDEEGNPILKFDARPKEVKLAEAPIKAQQMEKDLKRAFRETIDVSISYAIRSKWVAAQARFDQLVEKAFGKVGAKVKRGLDLIFGFVFFKCVGTILDYLTYPLRKVVKEIVYEYWFELDKNRKNILELLTTVPVDQPESEAKQHAVYNEDLIFKIGEVLGQTVQEFLENEPVVPVVVGEGAVLVEE